MPARLLITESLDGSRAQELRNAFLAQEIEAEIYPCLHLPEPGPADRVVIAIDRHSDTEQSIDDLLQLLPGVVPRPILAVLC